QKTERTNSLQATRWRVTGTNPQTADATRYPSSGLKPTTDWIGIPSAFHQTLPVDRRMSSSPNQFQTFQWNPFMNTHTHFSETSTLDMKKGLNIDIPLRIAPPNLSIDKA
ncbi:hypothetical protein HAX54_034718, partial [Datura stramonium]|nr:hypothetical protein [Datura stramonium]